MECCGKKPFQILSKSCIRCFAFCFSAAVYPLRQTSRRLPSAFLRSSDESQKLLIFMSADLKEPCAVLRLKGATLCPTQSRLKESTKGTSISLNPCCSGPAQAPSSIAPRSPHPSFFHSLLWPSFPSCFMAFMAFMALIAVAAFSPDPGRQQHRAHQEDRHLKKTIQSPVKKERKNKWTRACNDTEPCKEEMDEGLGRTRSDVTH